MNSAMEIFEPDSSRPVAGESVDPYKWLLIDGGGLVVTAWATHRDLENAEDRVRASIYVFVVCLASLARMTDDRCKIVMCWDGADNRAFRRGLHPWYKHGRGSVINRREVRVVMEQVEELLQCMGVATVSMPGCEADDVVATIARDLEKKKETCLIFSDDKDYMQLISEHIHLCRRSLRGIVLTPNQCELMGLDYGDKYLDIKAIMGDGGDNIRGLKGIGEKKAQEMIRLIPDLLDDCHEEPRLVDWDVLPKNLKAAVTRAGRRLVSPTPIHKNTKPFVEKFCAKHGLPYPKDRFVSNEESLRHAGLEIAWSMAMVVMEDLMNHPPIEFTPVNIERIPAILKKLDLQDEIDLLSSIYALARMRNPDAVPPMASANRAGAAIRERELRTEDMF